MMNRKYDNTLRAKVLEYINAGHSVPEAAKEFKIGPATIRHWHKNYKTNGTMTPKPRGGNHRRTMIDIESLKTYINENPEKTKKEIARYFSVTIDYITQKINKLKREGAI